MLQAHRHTERKTEPISSLPCFEELKSTQADYCDVTEYADNLSASTG